MPEDAPHDPSADFSIEDVLRRNPGPIDVRLGAILNLPEMARGAAALALLERAARLGKLLHVHQ